MTKFTKGTSGNPNGRALGSRNRKTLIIEALRQHSFLTGIKAEVDSLVTLIIKSDPKTSQQAELELIQRIRACRNGR